MNRSMIFLKNLYQINRLPLFLCNGKPSKNSLLQFMKYFSTENTVLHTLWYSRIIVDPS